ncbi:MAG: metallophosphoesterase family protein [Candidatus Hadarchaeota archaeon]|nr:metallophosphoesterase family protein [Candidatus Hadarchaeota archaeon]
MRIGVIADPHSNLAAFEAVLKHMPRVDALICAGDFVGYGAEPNEVIDLARKKNIPAVLGNHDYAAVTRDVTGLNPFAARAALWTTKELTEKNAEYLRDLPRELRLTLGGNSIYMVHGSPRRPLMEYIFPGTSNRVLLKLVQEVDADVIVLGHTHVPMKRMIQGKLLINPGGVGQPRDRDPRASYALLTPGDEPEAKFERVEYDVDKTAKKIEDAGLPTELATRLHFGW